MASNALTIYAGDDKTYDITILDEDGNAVNISGYTIKFSVKCNVKDTTFVIQKTTGSGITITDAANGVARLVLSAADTELDAGKYLYDIEVTDTSNRKTTVIFDNFVIKDDIT